MKIYLKKLQYINRELLAYIDNLGFIRKDLSNFYKKILK